MEYAPDEGSAHQRIDLVVFLATVVLSAVLMALPSSRQAAVADALRASVLRPVVAFHRWAGDRAEMEERLDELQRANRRLQRRLLRREGALMQNRQLRDLLSLGLPRRGEFLAADLAVGTPRLSRGGRFLVDVGRADGVRPPAGVVVAGGVVGVVRSVERDRAYGDLWTHPDFRVSVRTDSGGAAGVVRPVDAGAGAVMLFEGAPYQRRLPEGTLLVTTGAGGIYPPGVPVGRVREVSSVESGWARSYRVEPAVRPGEVRSVLVWRRPARPAATDTVLVRRGGRPPRRGDSASVPDSVVAPTLETVEEGGGPAAPAPTDSAAGGGPDSAGGRP